MTVERCFDHASHYSFLADQTLGAKLPRAEIVYQPVCQSLNAGGA